MESSLVGFTGFRVMRNALALYNLAKPGVRAVLLSDLRSPFALQIQNRQPRHVDPQPDFLSISDCLRLVKERFGLVHKIVRKELVVVLEAEVHYFHMCTDRTNPGFPDARRMNELVPVLADLADRWDQRQPHDEYHISRRLREWHKELIVSLDERRQ